MLKKVWTLPNFYFCTAVNNSTTCLLKIIMDHMIFEHALSCNGYGRQEVINIPAGYSFGESFNLSSIQNLRQYLTLALYIVLTIP